MAIYNPLTEINKLRKYYGMPVIDALSDFDKGVHQGRAEGLAMAERIVLD